METDKKARKISKDVERIMRIFVGMYQRTTIDKSDFKYWYGKKICDEWLNNPIKFYLWSIENGYKEDLTIDRIDNTKGYSPENCQWVTRQENSKRVTHKRRYLEYQGKKYYISELKDVFGINGSTILSRLNAGWDKERAFTEKPKTKG